MSPRGDEREAPPAPEKPEVPRRTNLKPLPLALLGLVALVLLVAQLRTWGGGRSSDPAVRTEPARTSARTTRGLEDIFGRVEPRADETPAPPLRLRAPRYNWAAVAARQPLRELTSPSVTRWGGGREDDSTLDRENPSDRLERLWELAAAPAEPAQEPAPPLAAEAAALGERDAFVGGVLRGREAVEARWLPPESDYVLQAGTHIPAILLTEMNTDLPSQVQARVTVPIYDSATGTIEILPVGARLVGVPDHRVVLGQRAALVTWDRAYLPDGSRLLLADEPGAGPRGDGGLRGRTRNHYGALYLNTLLVSLAGAGFQVSQGRDGVQFTDDPTQVAGAAVAQEFFRTSDEILRQHLRFLKPTLVKDVGDRFLVTVTRDYVFERSWR